MKKCLNEEVYEIYEYTPLMNPIFRCSKCWSPMVVIGLADEKMEE
jgi:hypothetical protein